jgi:hypothetical protein
MSRRWNNRSRRGWSSSDCNRCRRNRRSVHRRHRHHPRHAEHSGHHAWHHTRHHAHRKAGWWLHRLGGLLTRRVLLLVHGLLHVHQLLKLLLHRHHVLLHDHGIHHTTTACIHHHRIEAGHHHRMHRCTTDTRHTARLLRRAIRLLRLLMVRHHAAWSQVELIERRGGVRKKRTMTASETDER